FCCHSSHFLNERLFQNTDATFTLNRLQYQSRYRITIERGFKHVKVSFADADSAGERSKRRAETRSVCGGKGCEESTVEASAQSQNSSLAIRPHSAAPPPHEFERAFIRLRTGVTEKHTGRERHIRKSSRELFARLGS